MSETTLPTHIGFIVDGNRRWAKARGLDSFEGHQKGYEVLKEVLLDTIKRGVPYASAYAFSTENWKRSEREVKYLMDLFVRVLVNDTKLFLREGIRVRVLGSKEGLSRRVLKAIDDIEEATRHFTKGNFLLCFNYGGTQEIADAVKSIIRSDVEEATITPDFIAEHLYAPDVPPCDLIVRTSGEQRLSNFMMWRSAYSELLFLDKPWPDMTKQDITAILEEYSRRGRRFGG